MQGFARNSGNRPIFVFWIASFLGVIGLATILVSCGVGGSSAPKILAKVWRFSATFLRHRRGQGQHDRSSQLCIPERRFHACLY